MALGVDRSGFVFMDFGSSGRLMIYFSIEFRVPPMRSIESPSIRITSCFSARSVCVFDKLLALVIKANAVGFLDWYLSNDRIISSTPSDKVLSDITCLHWTKTVCLLFDAIKSHP